MEQIFNIPVQKVNEARKHLMKLQKRAGKMELKVFEFKFGEETKSHRFEVTTEDGDTFVSRYDYLELTVTQDITVHEGWTPIAKSGV